MNLNLIALFSLGAFFSFLSSKYISILNINIDIILDIIPAINPHSINILIFISTTIPIKADITIIASNDIKILNKSNIFVFFLISSMI